MREGVRCCQLLLYLAQTPEVEALGREPKLTWVNRTLLPFRVGDDLVFIHHLDVLVLHLITAGRERTEDSIRVWAAWPCHLSCLGLAGEVVGQAWDTPDGGVFLLVANVCVLGEKDGVVGQCGLTRGQDAPDQVAHHGQDPVVHKQVVHQELHRQRGRAVRCGQQVPLLLPTRDLGQSTSQCGASPATCPAFVMTLELHNHWGRHVPLAHAADEDAKARGPETTLAHEAELGGLWGPHFPHSRVTPWHEEFSKQVLFLEKRWGKKSHFLFFRVMIQITQRRF